MASIKAYISDKQSALEQHISEFVFKKSINKKKCIYIFIFIYERGDILI